MKRTLSLILALMMLMTLYSPCVMVHAESETIDVTYTNPVITADVGETVDLGSYLVQFTSEGTPEAATWSAADGTQVTSLKATEKGVVPYIAKNSNGDEKTVYFVTKNPEDTEYVLFEDDYSKYADISELKAEGYATTAGDEYYSFADGALVMGSLEHGYVRLILPEWLGDFGDYSITADVKMIETVDNARWFGIAYRIQNENKSYYPYFNMAIREKTSATNGIEFVERTSADEWNVASTASGKVNSMKSGYKTANVKAFEKNIQYNLDGTEVMFISDAVIGVNTPNYEKGMIGLAMNSGTVSIKNIKVTVQQSAPERPKRDLKLINNVHEENNLINPIANVESIDSSKALDIISGENAPGIVMLKVSEIEDLNSVVAKCVEEQVLPTFLLESQDDVVNVINAMNSSTLNDANAISADTALLENIRTSKPVVRTGLVVEIPEGEFTSEVADALRREIRSAPASFCVIKSADASYAVVHELQELAVAVWVQVEAEADSDEFAVEALRAVTSGANGIITKSANKLTEVINDNFEENAMTRTPVMLGHRGSPNQEPENSLSSFIKAFESGADLVELDVEITADGEIVIMHDSTLNRTTNYKGTATVNEMTLEEIKQYSLLEPNGSVSDEKVPTLREVFEEFKDKDCKIIVEFKGDNANNISTTCNLITEYGMEDKVDVISFNTHFLSLTQDYIPGMSTGYSTMPLGNASTPEDALEALYPSLFTIQTYKSSIIPSNNVATVYYMQAATDRGIIIWPWTYTASNNNSGFLNGCDGVLTNDIEWVTDMAKYLSASDISVLLDADAAIDVKAVTYGGTETGITGDDLIVKVLSGSECIKLEDGVITGVKKGTATVMYGYKTTTTNNSDYVLYSQPITVTVGVEGLSGGVIAIIIFAVIAVLAVAVAVIILNKKKRKQ